MFRKSAFGKAALAMAALAASLLTASPDANARPLDEVLKSGVLKVGVNPTLPPLAKFDEKNEMVGFDVDFATEIGKMLGVKVEFVQVGSPDRIPFVVSGKIDVVMGAMTRNPERAKVIDFTVPVHTEVFGVLTTEGKPFKSWKDLDKPEVMLIQVRGSTPVKFIEDNLKNAKVTLLDNYPDAIRALAQGRGDAMIDVIDFVGEQMNRFKDVKWKVVETPVDVYYCGMGVSKASTGLKDWLNVAIFEMHRRGKTDAAWKKWFGIDMINPTGWSPYF
ncbi:transporter substrate-binding domain-containing protein [Prosthecomicrobium hirschii]|uniref:Amino acid ABC transporter n=1 Tax=Prosthecodimorpha hirschii TaxID=665126 RepID=A0A0P6WDA8_9HYPH|nr:transporter substrate-binding domain-containing protein [Prosthecomicrobium hirschii]KPL52696.1 amino acid ABC transporter [Prosthecomicrobium hirschii]MCW1841592.1 transporter substrate-binding domain-containing protein [Prosthecomicrobium hirschii]